ncbi:unnamed protein product [Discula destructiva]
MCATRFLYTFLLACGALACDLHETGMILTKRSDAPPSASPPKAYDYTASWNWANLDPDAYGTCQNGSQQSPIALSLTNGLARRHTPHFNYPPSVAGKFKNWGYGPAFDVTYKPENMSSNPSITFDNETDYLVGWHIHTPGDHTINGFRSRAELHLVHNDMKRKARVILAILIEPGVEENPFIATLPKPFIQPNASSPNDHVETSLDLAALLTYASNFKEYWTYEGSLTSPPCTEGERWFVARQIMFVSRNQMKAILGASRYSARVEQRVWEHRINE